MKRMKRIKRDCDVDYHASARLTIMITPKTVENLHELVRKRCRTCIEIFLGSPLIKEVSFFHDLVNNRAAIAELKDLIVTYPDILQLRNIEDYSLLEVAVLQGQTEVVRLILEANEESVDGRLLMFAITYKLVEIVEIMVRPEILKRFGQSDIESAFMTTIGWLYFYDWLEPVFSALLAKMRRRALRETLNLCIIWNNVGAFKAILLHDPALVNVYGPDQADSKKLATTPLHLVVSDSRYEFIEFILDNFAERLNLELRDSNGRTAFERALATGVSPLILQRFLDMKPQLIRAVVDTMNVSAARLFLQDYGCVAYPKEDIDSRFKLILGMLKCDLNNMEAVSIDQEEMANILFDFIFEGGAKKLYPSEYLLEITAWSFLRSINSISEKCLQLFYLCEENGDRELIERALKILKLDKLYLIPRGQLMNGRFVLFWLHEKFFRSSRRWSPRVNEVISKLGLYTQKIVKWLFKRVFWDEEKLTVYYEVLCKISCERVWHIEDYILPPRLSSKDPNASSKLQIVYNALYSTSPSCSFVCYILMMYKIDKIKDFIKSGMFQMFLAFSPDGQDDLFYYLDETDDAEKKRQLLPILEPFMSIENRKKFGLHNKPIPLQELARLSVLKQLNGAKEWRCSDFIDGIDELMLPTWMKNYLLYMDKTPFKIIKN